VAAGGGNATHVNASSHVVDVLKALGNYGIFLQALQVGFEKASACVLSLIKVHLWCNVGLCLGSNFTDVL
jgi:hypothetical protein